jgi:hypothetical protein
MVLEILDTSIRSLEVRKIGSFLKYYILGYIGPVILLVIVVLAEYSSIVPDNYKPHIERPCLVEGMYGTVKKTHTVKQGNSGRF